MQHDQQSIHTTVEPGRLTDSPFQPRQHYNHQSILELATSIQQQGLLQEILVRPITQQQVDHAPGADLEIIFGHRRFRALLQLDMDIPVHITTMTDTEVRMAQLAENLQREDMSPIDEALGMAAAIAADEDMTPPRLAHELGVSRAYVYGYLKLCALTGRARDAVAERLIGTDIGTMIARLPPMLHDAALDAVQPRNPSDPDTILTLSLREARQKLKASKLINYLTSERVTWLLTDATVLDNAGACTACGSNTSTMSADIFQQFGRDMCLVSQCFNWKQRAMVNRMLERLFDEGWMIVNEAPAGATAYEVLEECIEALKDEHSYVLNFRRACARETGNGFALFRFLTSEHAATIRSLAYAADASTRSNAARAQGGPGTQGSDDDETTVATARDMSDRAPATMSPSTRPDPIEALRDRIVEGILTCERDMRTEDELVLVVAASLADGDTAWSRRIGLSCNDWNTYQDKLDELRAMSAAQLGRILLANTIRLIDTWAPEHDEGKSILLQLAQRYLGGEGEEEVMDDPGQLAGNEVMDERALAGADEVTDDTGLTPGELWGAKVKAAWDAGAYTYNVKGYEPQMDGYRAMRSQASDGDNEAADLRGAFDAGWRVAADRWRQQRDEATGEVYL